MDNSISETMDDADFLKLKEQNGRGLKKISFVKL